MGDVADEDKGVVAMMKGKELRKVWLIVRMIFAS